MAPASVTASGAPVLAPLSDRGPRLDLRRETGRGAGDVCGGVDDQLRPPRGRTARITPRACARSRTATRTITFGACGSLTTIRLARQPQNPPRAVEFRELEGEAEISAAGSASGSIGAHVSRPCAARRRTSPRFGVASGGAGVPVLDVVRSTVSTITGIPHLWSSEFPRSPVLAEGPAGSAPSIGAFDVEDLVEVVDVAGEYGVPCGFDRPSGIVGRSGVAEHADDLGDRVSESQRDLVSPVGGLGWDWAVELSVELRQGGESRSLSASSRRSPIVVTPVRSAIETRAPLAACSRPACQRRRRLVWLLAW